MASLETRNCCQNIVTTYLCSKVCAAIIHMISLDRMPWVSWSSVGPNSTYFARLAELDTTFGCYHVLLRSTFGSTQKLANKQPKIVDVKSVRFVASVNPHSFSVWQKHRRHTHLQHMFGESFSEKLLLSRITRYNRVIFHCWVVLPAVLQ